MEKTTHARLRLATLDGEAIPTGSSGYRSGRRRCRETPETASTESTRSAGTTPRASQLDTVLCAPKPSSRAKAVWPPTASHASSSGVGPSSSGAARRPGSFCMTAAINAQTVNPVNAETVNYVPHSARMSRQAQSEASPFWKRLTEAFAEQGLPTSQLGIAKLLSMSQGSVGRWFHAEGLPELETARDIARRGDVCLDWLMDARKPKYPISRDPVLRELFEVCEDLDDAGRRYVLRMARGELMQQHSERADDARAPGKRIAR